MTPSTSVYVGGVMLWAFGKRGGAMRTHPLHAAILLLPLALAGCAGKAANSTLLRESFDSGDTYARNLDVAPAQACEAARRVLLGQGYAIARADAANVE